MNIVIDALVQYRCLHNHDYWGKGGGDGACFTIEAGLAILCLDLGVAKKRQMKR